MRHRLKRQRLNRFTSWHKATLKSLARNLLIRQSIQTSLEKAKAARPLAEKLISLAKRNTLSAKREVFGILGSHQLVSLLFNEIAGRFANRASGYTRIIPLGRRRGDNSEIAILELTEIRKKEVKKHKKREEEKPAPEKGETTITKPEAGGEKKPEAPVAVKEKPPLTKKPTKGFFGGLRQIFKKERDSL